MTNTVAGVHLGPDTHANRPTASSVTDGTLYSCTDHNLIYQSNGSSWSTWATLNKKSGARVYNSGNISVANATNVTLTYDSEDFDTDSYHDTVSNTGRLTFPSDGLYLIGVQALWSAESTHTAHAQQLWIANSAGNILARTIHTVSVASSTMQMVTTIVEGTASDYVTSVVRQTSGETLSVQASTDNSPFFWIARLGV